MTDADTDLPFDVDQRRRQNMTKAEEESQGGPAREDPGATPLGDAIEAFHDRVDLSFGIPAHRSGTGKYEPITARWAGAQAFRADIGMNNGVDNRHQSWQVEPTAMKLFAAAVGADQTMFSTNGSTENVHVAMMAAVRPGETLVMARNGHKRRSPASCPERCPCTSTRSTTSGGRSPMASTRNASMRRSTIIRRPPLPLSSRRRITADV
jgi:hypothetical protein